MSGAKEMIRNMWSKIEETLRRNKKTALIAVGAIALLVAALSFNESTAKKEHADEHDNDKAHEGAAIVHLSKEAQKTSGVEVLAAALEPFSAPIEATAAIELDGDRVAKISGRTSGRLVKIAASQGDAVKTGQALAWSRQSGAWAGMGRIRKVKGKGRSRPKEPRARGDLVLEEEYLRKRT